MALSRDGSPGWSAVGGGGTLRLAAYLLLAGALMMLDHRNAWLPRLRAASALLVQPLWRLAGAPAQWYEDARQHLASQASLRAENGKLRDALLLANVRIARMQALVRQNDQLRRLLDAAETLRMQGQLARVIDIDLDPYRRRIVIDRGARQGVHIGQPVVDAHGVMGQVIEVLPDTAVVLLVTDPSAALPVLDARSGVRALAYGSGHGDQLELPNLAINADVRVGDELLSSGLGGRFPAGFPVATVTALTPDRSGSYLRVASRPLAHLNRSDHVLLLRDLAEPVGPPPPASRVGPPAMLLGPAGAASVPVAAPARVHGGAGA